MKVRAVLDTNVIVSALIRPKGPAGILWRSLSEGAFTAVFSPELIDEIAAVLVHPKIRTKYRTSPKDFDDIAALFALRGDLSTCQEKIRICRDPGDDFLIETAVSGNAGYIVTGDHDLLALKRFRRIRIVTLRAFLALLKKPRG